LLALMHGGIHRACWWWLLVLVAKWGFLFQITRKRGNKDVDGQIFTFGAFGILVMNFRQVSFVRYLHASVPLRFSLIWEKETCKQKELFEFFKFICSAWIFKRANRPRSSGLLLEKLKANAKFCARYVN
jgi:hypothetical protein